MDLNNIKLIIFDLDDTLWNGVLSENTVEFPENRRILLNAIVDNGVMISICSKNDENQTQDFLKRLGIHDLFVFSSINWTPKGERVRQIINEMQLREANVLFVEDNPSNRAEVKQLCPQIFVSDVDVMSQLEEYYNNSPKKDKERKRLKQYKILEIKADYKARTGSNEEFLRNSHIVCTIHHNCQDEIQRIHELILRSNQLNFTKVRSTLSELEADILHADDAGYIRVKDDFGDYGIVGFYCIKHRKLVHFVFSCRTLNMGIEQYVYRRINTPSLDIIGDVSSSPFNPIPDWINRERDDDKKTAQLITSQHNTIRDKIVLKGPCDLRQIFSILHADDSIIAEVTYVDETGVSIEGHNHTEMVLEAHQLSKSQKSELLEKLPWGNEKMLSTQIFDKSIKYVVYSTFTDPNLGLYRERDSGRLIAFGEYVNDLTNPQLWDDFIQNRVMTYNCSFTVDILEDFARNFEFVGRLSPEQSLANLKRIRSIMSPQTQLILVLGSETEYVLNNQAAYEDRHLYNQKLNSGVRDWIKQISNVQVLDVNDYIEGQSSFTNNINHFHREVYYKLAQKLLTIITDKELTLKSMCRYQFESFIQWLIGGIKRRLFRKFD